MNVVLVPLKSKWLKLQINNVTKHSDQLCATSFLHSIISVFFSPSNINLYVRPIRLNNPKFRFPSYTKSPKNWSPRKEFKTVPLKTSLTFDSNAHAREIFNPFWRAIIRRGQLLLPSKMQMRHFRRMISYSCMEGSEAAP